MNGKIKNVIGAIAAALTLVIVTVAIVRPVTISDIVGLAVAQTNTQWNAIVDGAKGDNITNGVLGTVNYLYNGSTFDRLRSIQSSDGVTSLGILSAGIEVINAGGTYDRLRGSISVDGVANTGMLNNTQYIYNGSTFDRLRGIPGADGVTGTGFQGVGLQLINAGGTYDRLRGSVSVDGVVNTGMLNNNQFIFNGTNYDRIRSATSLDSTVSTGVPTTHIATVNNTGGTLSSIQNISLASSRTVSATNTSQSVTLDIRNLVMTLDVLSVCSAGSATLQVQSSVDNTNFINVDTTASAASNVLQYSAGSAGGTTAVNPLSYRYVKATSGACGAGNTSTLTIGVK